MVLINLLHAAGWFCLILLSHADFFLPNLSFSKICFYGIYHQSACVRLR